MPRVAADKARLSRNHDHRLRSEKLGNEAPVPVPASKEVSRLKVLQWLNLADCASIVFRFPSMCIRALKAAKPRTLGSKSCYDFDGRARILTLSRHCG